MTTTSPTSKYTTTEYGKQNMFASQPPMEYVEDYKGYWVEAERLNGRLAMIGLFAAVHNYAIFGWVIPGIAWRHRSFTPPAYAGHFLTLKSNKRRKTMTPEAEKFNGWMAMIGFVAAVGAYITTGQIIPGIF